MPLCLRQSGTDASPCSRGGKLESRKKDPSPHSTMYFLLEVHTREPLPINKQTNKQHLYILYYFFFSGIDQTYLLDLSVIPVANSWTVKAPMLDPRFLFGIGSNGDNLIYIFGGVHVGHRDDIDKYDTELNVWTRISARLPTISYEAACADGKDGIIWVFVVVGRTLHTLDTTTDNLTQISITGIPSCKTDIFNYLPNCAWVSTTFIPHPLLLQIQVR